ncbi:TPA: KilA-N domain-containing protein [Escherichia coli]|nr:KilA-N domain-containing protein [Escherichia coli]HEM0050318.1 KilA-N domain-containing protein [Escherichia coli]
MLSWSTSNNWKQNGDASAPVVAPLFSQREGIYRPKSGRRDASTYWLALDGTKKLIAELEKQTTGITVVTKEGFAHELLAVEYAGWISPAFRLHVNQTFIDYRTGKRNGNRYGCWWAASSS